MELFVCVNCDLWQVCGVETMSIKIQWNHQCVLLLGFVVMLPTVKSQVSMISRLKCVLNCHSLYTKWRNPLSYLHETRLIFSQFVDMIITLNVVSSGYLTSSLTAVGRVERRHVCPSVEIASNGAIIRTTTSTCSCRKPAVHVTAVTRQWWKLKDSAVTTVSTTVPIKARFRQTWCASRKRWCRDFFWDSCCTFVITTAFVAILTTTSEQQKIAMNIVAC